MKKILNLLRLLLFPFSIVYGLITFARNWLYNKGILKSFQIPCKSIVIGNLSTGGTGKSPHTAFIASHLTKKNKVAVLSRGYGRKTKGYFKVDHSDLSEKVGDEPLMLRKILSEDISVHVCESRVNGVKEILRHNSAEVIVLDDAYQHRKVKAGFYIMLSTFQKPYFSDFVLPSGNLREFRLGEKRANCIVFTKCPNDINNEQKKKYTHQVKANVPVFFSKIKYSDMLGIGRKIENPSSILLVTGIANPEPLLDFLKPKYQVETMFFKDHHDFTLNNIQNIHSKFDTFAQLGVSTLNENKYNSIILTTEKDFVKIDKLLSDEQKDKYPWYIQTIDVEIEEEDKFLKLIDNYVDSV